MKHQIAHHNGVSIMDFHQQKVLSIKLPYVEASLTTSQREILQDEGRLILPKAFKSRKVCSIEDIFDSDDSDSTTISYASTTDSRPESRIAISNKHPVVKSLNKYSLNNSTTMPKFKNKKNLKDQITRGKNERSPYSEPNFTEIEPESTFFSSLGLIKNNDQNFAKNVTSLSKTNPSELDIVFVDLTLDSVDTDSEVTDFPTIKEEVVEDSEEYLNANKNLFRSSSRSALGFLDVLKQKRCAKRRKNGLDIPLSSPLGQRILSYYSECFPTGKNAISNYEKYCQTGKLEHLRERGKSTFPLSCNKKNRYNGFVHLYKFSKADRREFFRVFHTGLTKQSRILTRKLSPCRVMLKRLPSNVIQFNTKPKEKCWKTTVLYDINCGQLVPTKEVSSLEKVSRLVPKFPGSMLPSIMMTAKGTVMTHPADLLNDSSHASKLSSAKEEAKDVIVLSDSDEENCEITYATNSHRPIPMNPCTNKPDCQCNTIFKCRLCEFENSYECNVANSQIQNHLNSHGRGVFIMRESLVTSRGNIFKAVEILPSSSSKSLSISPSVSPQNKSISRNSEEDKVTSQSRSSLATLSEPATTALNALAGLNIGSKMINSLRNSALLTDSTNKLILPTASSSKNLTARKMSFLGGGSCRKSAEKTAVNKKHGISVNAISAANISQCEDSECIVID